MRVIHRLTGLFALVTFLAACGPEATPFPVEVPSPEASRSIAPLNPAEAASTASVAPGMIRYGLAANTAGLVIDLSLLEQAAQVETLDAPASPDDLGSRYDIIATYGDLPGGQRSPVEHHVALLLNSAIPPLDNAEITSILRQALDPQAVLLALNIPGAAPEPAEPSSPTGLRVQLANAGWPDGFDLNLVYDDAPGAEAIAGTLQPISIMIDVQQVDDIPTAFAANPAHLALVRWTAPEARADWENRVGADNFVPLYTLPISYLAVEGLIITFTPAGWPIAQR